MTLSQSPTFQEKYWIDSSAVIGRGRGTIVRVCYARKSRGAKFAVKTVNKSRSKAVNFLRNEISIMKQVSEHPSINSLVDVFEDGKEIHLITELCLGGHLGHYIEERIIKNPNPDYSKVEYEAACIIKQLLEAVSHLQERNIIHRDLKLDNVLFKKNKSLQVRLIDFDISTIHNEEEEKYLTKQVGTRAYMAPEVLDRQYTKACDIWSLGVIAYTLICGELPFSGSDTDELYSQIHHQPVTFTAPIWEHVSQEAKDFIMSSLTKDPTKRAGVAELLTHDWMDTTLCSVEPSSPRPSKLDKGIKGLKRMRSIFEGKPHHKIKTSLFPPHVSRVSVVSAQ